MDKVSTIQVQVNPTVKQQAEEVLDRLGVSMAAAVGLFLQQVALKGRIPFLVSQPVQASETAEAETERRAETVGGIVQSLIGAIPGTDLDLSLIELQTEPSPQAPGRINRKMDSLLSELREERLKKYETVD